MTEKGWLLFAIAAGAFLFGAYRVTLRAGVLLSVAVGLLALGIYLATS